MQHRTNGATNFFEDQFVIELYEEFRELDLNCYRGQPSFRSFKVWLPWSNGKKMSPNKPRTPFQHLIKIITTAESYQEKIPPQIHIVQFCYRFPQDVDFKRQVIKAYSSTKKFYNQRLRPGLFDAVNSLFGQVNINYTFNKGLQIRV